MPNLRLKRDAIVPTYPNTFRVILTMADGELDVGEATDQTGVDAREARDLVDVGPEHHAISSVAQGLPRFSQANDVTSASGL